MSRRQFEPNQGRLGPILVSITALLVIVAAFRSFYTVDTNEQAVVLRFGKYHTTAPPGLHFCIPFVDTVMTVGMEEHIMRLPVGSPGSGDRPGRINEADTLMLTGDLNAAAVEWTVQWQVSEPDRFLFCFHDRWRDGVVEDVIRISARTVMNRLVGDYSIDEILTEKRAEIAAKAREATQAMLDQYECGVSITELQMQRVTPPEQVKPAFAAVNSAVQKRDQLENEANKTRNELLPAAQADRDKKIREAQGYADRRRSEVNGELSALRAKFEAYRKAPEVTKQRLYLEAMERVLSKVQNTTIIDADLKQVLPLLQLGEGGAK